MKNQDLSILKALLLKEIEESAMCNECGGPMYEGMCTECGWMEEALHGGQKKLDVAEPFGKLTGADFKKLRGMKKEDDSTARVDQMQKDYKEMYNLGYQTGYADAQSGRKPSPMMENDSEHGKKFDKAVDSSELNMLKKLYAKTPTAKIKAMIDKIEAKMNENHEGTDHEVSMANNSIDSIIWAAHELKKHLQGGERDIPAWIQDHITNAENYILQAAKNYHEYGSEEADQEDDFSGTYDDGLDEMSLQEMIKKVGKKYNVYSKKGKKLGSHPSKKKAQKQMAAIEISKQGK